MQLELPVQAPSTTTQRELADLDQLARYLRAAPGWHRASEILEAMGLPVTETAKRRIRRLSELADGQIISGQEGYKHIDHATPGETHHAAAWLMSQAQRVTKHALAILRCAHAKIHNPTPANT